MKNLNLYGLASGIGGKSKDVALGPLYMYYHPELFADLPFTVEWSDMIMTTSDAKGLDVAAELAESLTMLAEDTAEAVKSQQPFCAITGEHSSAIGTWSGVASALLEQNRGDLGLIWVDAHMDAHTPETSPSKDIHGMPIAHLLGQGIPALCNILNDKPKLKPENICLIGIRSFEAGEAKLLEKLNIKVFMIEEVQTRGIDAVIKDAKNHLKNAANLGITIDLDGFDPTDAPGVCCVEPGGIDAKAFLNAVKGFHHTPGFVGLEITEYNPIADQNAKTAILLRDLIGAIFGA